MQTPKSDAPSTPEPSDARSEEAEKELRKGIGEYVREAWSQALVAVSATEDEVQKIVGKVTGWVEVGPDEAKRLGTELTERLKKERGELEDSIQAAVKKTLQPFRLPTKDDIGALDARIADLEQRLAKLAERRRS